MFADKIYIPILRWKDAERKGLAKLDPAICRSISPCFEFIMPNAKLDEKFNIIKTSKEVLIERTPKIVEEINKCYIGNAVLIDVHLIDSDLRASTFKYILDHASQAKTKIVPTTHILPVNSSDADMEVRRLAVQFAKSSGNGICIRIDRFNIGDVNISDVIDEFLTRHALDLSSVDIMIDLAKVNGEDSAESLGDTISAIRQIKKCRTFIVSSGAFPPDLTEIEPYTTHQISRDDWLLANKLTPALEKSVRKPVYSDYTIQHPLYSEPIPGGNTSASIRYSAKTFWQVYRGKGLRGKNSPGYAQYPAQANLLANDKVFMGAEYSTGDAYIAEKAKDGKKPGNPTTWLTAGINHHLTLVVKQLTS